MTSAMRIIIATAGLLLAQLACVNAQQQPLAPLAVPATPSGYETPPVFKASDLWDASLLNGPHHQVREAVTTSGFTNTYVIDSDFGVFYANGDHLLPERVREIYAIAAIRATKTSDAYTKAVGAAAAGTLKGAGNLVTHPGGTLKGLGKGAVRFMRSAGERVKTTTEGNDAATDLSKYNDARRQIAGKYNVDPYTSNSVYQDEVNSVATAATAGGLTFSLATMAIPGAGGAIVGGVGLSQDLNDMLVKEGPYDLRVQNRNRLREMGVDDRYIEPFLNHPHFTPRHHTAIVLALGNLNQCRFRSDFIRLSLAARSEEDAILFSYSAGLLALYNAKRSPITAIVACNGLPAGYSGEGTLLLPLLLDYGSWTEVGDRFVNSFLAYDRADYDFRRREIVITGRLSDRAKKELASRNVALTEIAFETLRR